MVDYEILEKVYKKAKKNGFKFSKNSQLVLRDNYIIDFVIAISIKSYYSFIFSHSFAKAFWGKEKRICMGCGKNCDYCGCENNISIGIKWQYHLQQMVLEKEPLKYLEKFL